jgi:arylamine N-acetyltransferase
MVNIVTIDGQRYWVDVGFGSGCSIQPIPLQSGVEFDCILPMRGKLEYRSIADHSDPNQRLWVYSSREDANAPWKEMYTFIDVEFFAADFEVMNLSTMTSPRSFFVKAVMAMRMILSEETGKLEGVLILHKDYVKRRLGETTELLEELTSEEQRVRALERYFQIVLKPSEQKAIRGLATELIG